MMESRPIFTWIHLSDIHVGHGDAKHTSDQKLVLNELRTDIQNLSARSLPQLDAIFVTGDLAFSGAVRDKSEYTQVRDWLTSVAGAVSLNEQKIFAVPGNHDVQRNVEEKDPSVAELLRSLRAAETQLDNVMADGKKRTLLLKRMRNYFKLACSLAPAHCSGSAATPKAQVCWSHEIPLEDALTVRLVGLNTALLAAKEEDTTGDYQRLQVGKDQLVRAFTMPSVRPEEVVIALSHHPFNWLRDEADVSPSVKKYAHIHLCGHVHDAESERSRSGSGMNLIRIVAGAAHDEAGLPLIPARHGYSVGSLQRRQDGHLIVRIWPRIWSKHREFRVDRDSIPAEDENGLPYREDYVDHQVNLKPNIPASSQNSIQAVNGETKIGHLPGRSGFPQAVRDAGRDLRLQEKNLLVDAFLECPSIRDRNTRESVLLLLPTKQIANAARRNEQNRADVFGIVSACLNYPGGIFELAEAVRSFDDESRPMGHVDKLLGELFPESPK